MDLKRLGYFVRVAELGSLNQAADRVLISQPSLSRQIRLLEEELGLKLFDRHCRGMQLTPEGEALLARIRGPLQELETALRDARALADQGPATLVFGVPATVGALLAGPLARRVAKLAPHISLRIVEGHAGALAKSIGRGEVDLAMLYGPASQWPAMVWGPLVGNMLVEELLVEDLVLVGGADCALDPATAVDFATLARLPLILPEPQSQPYGLRRLIEEVAARSGVTPSPCFRADSFQLTKDLVESGVGYAVLPPSSIRRELANGRLRCAPLPDPRVTRELVLALNPGAKHRRAADRLKELVRQEVAALVRSGEWPATLCEPGQNGRL